MIRLTFLSPGGQQNIDSMWCAMAATRASANAMLPSTENKITKSIGKFAEVQLGIPTIKSTITVTSVRLICKSLKLSSGYIGFIENMYLAAYTMQSTFLVKIASFNYQEFK